MSRFDNIWKSVLTYQCHVRGAWLYERLRRWSNKPDVVGSIPVTTEFFLISSDSNQVPKWFGTLDSGGPII